ncbi:MAG: hypothetical protein HY826_10145 [Actinobacteria bacterium]|nr:hypothetical protein [Actinomycetota bacterium]
MNKGSGSSGNDNGNGNASGGRLWFGLTRRQLLRGALAGIAAGAVAAGAWFAIVAGTSQMQAYLIPVVGAAAAYGVHLGMRGSGRGHAILSIAITSLVVIVAMYYVERLLVVRWFAANGDDSPIPIVPYLDWLWSVLRRAFTTSPSPAVYSGFALLAAGWLGHQGFDASHPRHR